MRPTNPFGPFLEGAGYALLDGGLSNALEDRGIDLRDPLWTARVLIDAPEILEAVHRDYLDAGADCIATASYQATLPGLRAAGLDDRMAVEVLERSVGLAVRVRDRFWADCTDPARFRPIVAASVGPYGAFLADGSEYDGRYGVSASDLRDFHARRFDLLAGAGPDLLALETIPSLLEAEVLLDLLETRTACWAWLSVTCRDRESLRDGTPITEIADLVRGRSDIAAVGVNCTEPVHVLGLVETLSRCVTLPIVVYANSGERYDPEEKCWCGGFDVQEWTESAARWRAAGASVIGGCCRIGPGVIRSLRGRWDRG